MASPLFRAQVQVQTRLARKFGVIETSLRLPWSDIKLQILQPASFDRLLTTAAGDPEQNPPYWATIWPSGVALADAILQEPEWLIHRHVLELGCGLGITAIAALAAGARLLVTDYAPESMLLCRANALRSAGLAPRTLRLNWREPSPELLARAPFPIVLAADVLYEHRDVMPLLRLIERVVARDGMLWLAEPGRAPAQQFVAAAEAAGWQDQVVQHAGPWPDPQDRNVVVNLHRLRRGR